VPYPTNLELTLPTGEGTNSEGKAYVEEGNYTTKGHKV
jgi:hypothetical protein